MKVWQSVIFIWIGASKKLKISPLKFTKIGLPNILNYFIKEISNPSSNLLMKLLYLWPKHGQIKMFGLGEPKPVTITQIPSFSIYKAYIFCI